ncbi:hypothetical protein NEFER03_0475 [Nematocida sp. LUAm3]|nr:hypothetical protein NEFER03_0475 [Nematocida sp. LUAm3]KAI5175932.1 hypothetical protein NEFER02_1792 [Nematocida sp. LUAm2]KAI5178686.1 hypothetical protein NEFER01_1805 [Nematocida sp. LUAm1]
MQVFGKVSLALASILIKLVSVYCSQMKAQPQHIKPKNIDHSIIMKYFNEKSLYTDKLMENCLFIRTRLNSAVEETTDYLDYLKKKRPNNTSNPDSNTIKQYTIAELGVCLTVSYQNISEEIDVTLDELEELKKKTEEDKKYLMILTSRFSIIIDSLKKIEVQLNELYDNRSTYSVSKYNRRTEEITKEIDSKDKMVRDVSADAIKILNMLIFNPKKNKKKNKKKNNNIENTSV